MTKNETSTSPEHELKQPRITLENGLILSKATRRMFEEAIGAMRHHKTIYTDWGFDEVDPMGRNMVINFYGPPGTGKTLAAEGLAGSLERSFIHIGTSELESKYVGETAKNISAAFKLAASEGAILFFDEADTLLGARLSNVTQGIDNEINSMRSTLLIELERFDGVVVFATNFPKNYDSAFVSRIRYHIEFELPDLDARKQLWNKNLVLKVPLGEPRYEVINKCAEASEGLSGREIRTVLRTAFPRALVENPEKPVVLWEHLKSAIDDVWRGKKDVGKKTRQEASRVAAHENAEESEIGKMARNALGITVE